MIKKNLFLLCLLITVSQAWGQNFYRSPANQHYWKNRLPKPGYWQQDVHYTIKARVDEKRLVIFGTQELQYWNNSPDTLQVVFFHLYQNAFQPESYSHSLHINNGVNPVYGPYEKLKLGTTLENMKQNGTVLKTELDNTILKVWLTQPLLPGQSTTFSCNFRTFFDSGSVRRRMKIFKAGNFFHFDGVHWYPRISVYDAKMGWDTQQHLGKEFYGDFGTYDVELTFASNYIVEATGELINEAEVLPGSLREKLDLSNFANKKWESKATEIIPYDEKITKTWKYHAENVHDFAFTADPTYRIGEVKLGNIRCIAVAQEGHASRWQNAAAYAAKVIDVYNKEVGQYIYPKMVVADARDGMEYPMLTLDGGQDPDYRSLLAHEIGHNWFFGMVGSNETYRAALDEGFTQFIQTIAQQKIDGAYDTATPSPNFWIRKFQQRNLVTDRYFMNSYINEAARGYDKPLNTHSDEFETALGHGGGYRNVYFKTATMLSNLKYVLGDSLFSAAFKNYFNSWYAAHPYMEDFRNSIIRFTKTDLNWFFDQWLETTKNIDYAVHSVRKRPNSDTYTFKLKRKGEMQMPLDLQLVVSDSEAYNFHIPNNWFVKPSDANVLQRWIGWGKVNPTYSFSLALPDGFNDIIIDPNRQLADVNNLNNRLHHKLKLRFDALVHNPADRHHYELFARPDVWYNFYDGIKLGAHINGNYLNLKHIIHGTIWFNTGLGQYIVPPAEFNNFELVSINLSYKHGLPSISKNLWFSANIRSLDGLQAYQTGIEKYSNSQKSRFFLNLKGMYRHSLAQAGYLLSPYDWSVGRFNSQVNMGVEHTYTYSGSTEGDGNVLARVKTIGPGSNFSFAQISLQAINHTRIDKMLLHTRFFGMWGSGNDTPLESQLYLAGASPEEMMENKYMRSKAFFPVDWSGYGDDYRHLHYGGGLNLRAYSGYLAPEVDPKGNILLSYAGRSGASCNIEADFNEYFGIRTPKLSRYLHLATYAFANAGFIALKHKDQHSIGAFRADAGIGMALTIKSWGGLQKVKPLTLRFDVPFWVNRTPAVSPDFLQFRWIVGINRAF